MEKYFKPVVREAKDAKPRASFAKHPAVQILYEINGSLQPSLRRFWKRFNYENFEYTKPDVKHGFEGTPFFNSPYVAEVQFDQSGELLASGGYAGELAIYSFDRYLTYRTLLRTSQGDTTHLELRPLLQVNIEQKLSGLRWNPANQNEVALSFSSLRDLHIYDLSVCGNEPTQKLECGEGGGFFDVCFIADKPDQVVAGSRDGGVRIWDSRKSKRPRKLLHASSARGNSVTASICSLLPSSDGVSLTCGTSDGDIIVWDLRHPATVVKSFNISHLLSSDNPSTIPGPSTLPLRSDWVPLKMAPYRVVVHSMTLHPLCSRHVAVQLANSTSALINIDTCSLTSRFVPKDTDLNSASHKNLARRKASFSPSDGTFFTGVAGLNTLSLVDFCPSSCALADPLSPHNSALKVPAAVVSTAFHPYLDWLVCGLANNGLCAVGYREKKDSLTAKGA
mmetsp:Transcript_45684/g.74503  ORF Transcript_45684/g.74503 Transcript_45684/m.74503 type:complete len:450 (+) Transcript_45684:224-1573(+)